MKPTTTTITVPVSVVQTVSEVQQLAGLANACGSQGDVRGENVCYKVFNHLLPANLVGIIQALAPHGVVMTGYDETVYDTHPRHTRYLAVTDPSASLPTTVPSSSITAEDESVRQLTWQEVLDLPTVGVSPVDGAYHINVTAHLGHRGLSNLELAAMDGLALLTQDELPTPSETSTP